MLSQGEDQNKMLPQQTQISGPTFLEHRMHLAQLRIHSSPDAQAGTEEVLGAQGM